MFIIHGRRSWRVKDFTDNRNFCKSCGSPNLHVFAYRQYFHIFWMPFFPTGNKEAYMVCGDCAEPFRNEAIQTEHENNIRPPFYLYAGPILIAALIVLLFVGNIRTQKQKAAFVANPQVGDVYRIRTEQNDQTYYYFMQVTEINGDTVIFSRNTLLYSRFVSGMNQEDFFDKEDKISIAKPGLKKMLDNNDINGVDRN